MKICIDMPVFSIRDVVAAYTDYDASEEAKEPILFFLSEMTGLSVDRIMEIAEKVKEEKK